MTAQVAAHLARCHAAVVALLGRLQAMAEASQLSNMAAYLPTGDSPHCVSLLPTTAIAAAARPSATRTHPRHTHPFR